MPGPTGDGRYAIDFDPLWEKLCCAGPPVKKAGQPVILTGTNYGKRILERKGAGHGEADAKVTRRRLCRADAGTLSAKPQAAGPPFRFALPSRNQLCRLFPVPLQAPV